MTFFESQEKVGGDTDPEMVRILQEMLDSNETITARAVARKHPVLKHASSVTRSSERSNLLSRFQSQQYLYREWQERMPKRSREQLADQLAQKDSRIAELERQVEVLRVSQRGYDSYSRRVGGCGQIAEAVRRIPGGPK
jgi:hypothetical protein